MCLNCQEKLILHNPDKKNCLECGHKKRMFSLIFWLTVWLTDWLTFWLTVWLTVWLTFWLTIWLTVWLTDWLADWLTVWLTVWLTDWLTDWLKVCLTVWLTVWLTNWKSCQWNYLEVCSCWSINYLQVYRIMCQIRLFPSYQAESWCFIGPVIICQVESILVSNNLLRKSPF